MRPFWTFVGMMARQRGRLLATLFFAFLSLWGSSRLAQPRSDSDPDRPSGGWSRTERHRHGVQRPARWLPDPLWVIDRLPTDQFDGVVLLIIFIAVLTVLGAACNFMHQFCSQTMTTNTVALVRSELFARVDFDFRCQRSSERARANTSVG